MKRNTHVYVEAGFRFVVAAVVFAGAVMMCAMCAGCTSAARDKALTATLANVNVARDTFTAYDRAHQEKIVEDAASLELGQETLREYRAKREPVLKAFLGAYQALAIAAVLKDDATSMANLSRAVGLLLQAIDDLTGGAP